MAKLLVICAAATMLGLSLTSQALVYTVGDRAGWDISADFPSWVAGKTFHVGDALYPLASGKVLYVDTNTFGLVAVFQFSQYHTLNEVDKVGYDNCSASNALFTNSTGNATVPLTTAGDKYFICGVLLHCLGGMKLRVYVTSNQSTVFYPQAPSSPVHKPSTDVTSDSYHLAKGSMFAAWSCTFGALLWLFVVRA